jgi:hypothetical protein
MIPQGDWFGLLSHHRIAIFLEAGDDVHIRKLRHDLPNVIVKLDEDPFQQLHGADGSHELGHRCYPANGIACEGWRDSFEVELSCTFEYKVAPRMSGESASPDCWDQNPLAYRAYPSR